MTHERGATPGCGSRAIRLPQTDPARLTDQSNAAVSETRFASYRRGNFFSDDPAEACPDAAKGYDDAGSSGDSARQLDRAFVRLVTSI